MNSLIRILPLTARLGFGLAAIFSARAVRANDNDLRVDVVVDMTAEGDKLPHPSPESPQYYFPYTAGYLQMGDVLTGEKPPPPTVQVERMLARALKDRGYTVMDKVHHPSIILILWWGYMAPVIGRPFGDTANGSAGQASPGSVYMTGVGISAGTNYGPSGKTTSDLETPGFGAYSPDNNAGEYSGPGVLLPTGGFVLTPNDHEMFTLVAGANFEESIGNWDSFGRGNGLHEAAHHPRYFLMVSALDFQAATQHKPVLLWCARVSTELAGHTLDGVLPSLIDTGVKSFGESTGVGPKFTTVPAIPMGRVLVGTPVLKNSYQDKPASP